jgi:hypothetical protein
VTKKELNKRLGELVDIYVGGMKGPKYTQTRQILWAMAHKAAWYGAQCATRASIEVTENLFDHKWLEQITGEELGKVSDDSGKSLEMGKSLERT